jgi:hypothetical protein
LAIVLFTKPGRWLRVRLLGAEVSSGEAGATVKNVKSRKGAVVARDESGTKASVENAEAEKDVRAEVTGSPKK